jgi:hypothetical protein
MPTMILAQAAPALECQAVTINTKAVALPSARVLNPVVDFSGSGGQLDPTPLLQTDIDVAPSILARGGCLVVHFSTQADPQDNAIIFQVSLDNVPMTGHGAILFSTPVVADPEETDKNLSRMLSYTFFAPLTAGKHTIRVRIASCCTSNPTGGLVVRAATLVAQY